VLGGSNATNPLVACGLQQRQQCWAGHAQSQV